MSVTIDPYAVVGILIDSDKLYIKTRVKAFDHKYTATDKNCDDESFEFDPKTGKALWKEVSEPIPGYDEARQTLAGFKLYETGRGWKVAGILATPKMRLHDGERSTFAPDNFLVAASLEAKRSELRNALSELGLWDDNKFGLYCVCYWS